MKKAIIHYYDIGDYKSREEKLEIVKQFGSIDKIPWTTLYPNKHGDWINLRNEGFKEFIPLEPKKKFDVKAESVYMTYAIGLASNRDAWVYNFSNQAVEDNIKRMIDFYNQQVNGYEAQLKKKPNLKVENFIDTDTTKISWTVNLKNSVGKLIEYRYNGDIRKSLYRPFCTNNLYYDESFLERPGLSRKLFPSPQSKNLVICVSGISSSKDFSCLISEDIPDLQVMFNDQCFPLFWYEKNEHLQKTLFDEESTDDYIRRDGVSDWILKEVRSRFGGTKKITKETIFYYVYGLLHNKEYRETYASDLKKSLPRIPIVDDVEAFMDFAQAGKALAHLHLDYESIEPYAGLKVIDNEDYEDKPNIQEMAAEEMSVYYGKSEYDKYRVEKMRFPAKGKKDTIIYNARFTITNIPSEAYDYVVNGKSAIEWIMERYAVTIDKASGIKNDPNDWSKEHNKPRYVLDLLLSVINVSVQTVKIVKRLPQLTFTEDGSVKVETNRHDEAELDMIFEDFMPKENQESTPKESVEKPKTLNLGIYQEYFDAILSGEKKIEYRQVVPYTYKHYLQLDSMGQPKCNPTTTVRGKTYNLNDENGGHFPFLIKPYQFLRLYVKASHNTVLVEVKQITTKYQDSRWWMEYHLGIVFEKEQKKE
jgi:predicted helicase